MYEDRQYYAELLETCMNRLHEEWVPTEDIPALPSTGTMDVTVVLESSTASARAFVYLLGEPDLAFPSCLHTHVNVFYSKLG